MRSPGAKRQAGQRCGGLAGLLELEVVASLGGNVIEVTHNRLSPDVAYSRTGVEMLLEVRDAAHIAEIESGLRAHGYPVRRLD